MTVAHFSGEGYMNTSRLTVGCAIARLIAVCLANVVLFRPATTMAQDNQVASTRTLVIIVPGAAGNASFWTNIESGQVTFASELQRAEGPGTEIYPYLWNGGVDHASREAAAKELASIIDQKAGGFDRVCLVGHSFGGDIALRAAGECTTHVDTVVCLATPHAYLLMQTANQQQLFVPVYCTWESRQNIKTIVNVYPQNDAPVVNAANNFKRMELTEADAIPLTQSWQEHVGFPRLLNDDLSRHFFRLENNLVMAEPLNVGNVNITIQSLVKPGPTFAEHSAIHSRRMGYVVGELLRDGLTPDRISYVSTKIEAANADSGGPMPEANYQAFLQAQAQRFQHVGWRLNQITVDLLPQTINIAGNLNGTLPSPLIKAVSGGNNGRPQTWSTAPVLNTLHASWQTDFIAWNGQTYYLSLQAYHDIGTPTDLGGISITADNNAPFSTITANPSGGGYWSASLTWVSVHY
jgi:pimeloyl-ACP methyl ester carboxylesterase